MAKLRNHVAIAGLLALVMLAAGWFMLVSPQRSKAAGFRADAAQTRSASSALQTQLALLKAQAKQLPKQQARLHAIAVKVPSNPAEPALVRLLTKAAKDAGVDLSSIAPATPTLVESGPAAVTTPASGTTTGGAPGPLLALAWPLSR
jgi:Tfp pilus assembly protein PilO